MKQKTLRIFIAITCAALLLFANAAASGIPFSFRGGVTWDTASTQMLALEGLTENDGSYNREEYNGYIFFYLRAQNVYYVYRGDVLVQAYTVKPESAYAAQLETATAAYGAPVEIDANEVALLWNTLVPGSVTLDALRMLSAWQLPDGTLAALFVLDGKTCMAYFHPQRILGG